MWKDYSRNYIKNNRSSSISIITAAFIAALFLSLLCSLAYNFWTYEIEKIVLDEGDWQGRIIANLQESDLAVIENFSNVRKAIINEEFSKEGEKAIDIYFKDARSIYQDMPLILEKLELENSAAEYHSLLLSRYFIHDPLDNTPPLLMAFYLAILLIMSFSLILIIRNSFELSMNARIHQFGIFSSIGATPKQIKICLLQEATVLCSAPILIGSLIGILISFGLIEIINFFAADVSGRHKAAFWYHPIIFIITIFVSAFTVLVSAWIPARKLSKMSPLEAIRNTKGLQLKKRKHSKVLSLLFGIEGELAGNALKAQRKSFRISAISLLLSFLGFSIMLCFTTLSGISTKYTYFERYKDAWDIIVTIKNTPIENIDVKQQLQEIEDIEKFTIYQKAQEMIFISADEQSEELAALGGLESVAAIPKTKNGFWVKTPVVVLDDESFLDYCSQIGAVQQLNGTIILNKIWDSKNSNFRYKKYIPFLKENKKKITLYSDSQNGRSVEIPIVSYTEEVPALREEYDNYTLVNFVSLSAWKNLMEKIEEIELDSYIRIFYNGTATLENLNKLEQEIVSLVGQKYEIESENRIKEKVSNDDLINGMVMIFSSFCVLIAIIGIANVFSNTLGFLRQRQREFAQYMSIGITPSEMRKMFCIEAFVISGKPLLITFVLTVVFMQFMIAVSYLEPMVFWKEAPIVPILIFAVIIAGFVALAYYIGGKRLLRCDLNETLRNDSLT